MSEHPPDPGELELAAELEQLGDEQLRLESVDPQTGERRFEGFVARKHLAQATLERDEL